MKEPIPSSRKSPKMAAARDCLIKAQVLQRVVPCAVQVVPRITSFALLDTIY